jgi:hypothetical protein
VQGELALIKSQSVANQVGDFEYPEKIGKYWNPPFIEFEGEKCLMQMVFLYTLIPKLEKKIDQDLKSSVVIFAEELYQKIG